MNGPPGRPGAPTISQVAAAAGVSRATVSRSFTRPRMLRPETVSRVLQVAQTLGYVPNRSARALSTGRHGNVALIVPDVANPFFPPLIRAAQIEADRVDLCVVLGSSGESASHEDKLVERVSGQVEGLILASSRLPDERIRAHAQRRPMVLVNRDVEGIPRVLVDSGVGVAAAVRHLAGLGHRHLAYVAGPAASWSNRQRATACRRAAKPLGVAVTVIPSQAPSHEAGRACVAPLLESGATAILAFDDLLAQGILVGLAERGIAVPGRISLVGCDDVLGAATWPALTTVTSRSAEAGRIAFSLLLEVLESQAVRDVRYVLDTDLVLRATTARPSPATTP